MQLHQTLGYQLGWASFYGPFHKVFSHLGLKLGCSLGARMSASLPLPIEIGVDWRTIIVHELVKLWFSFPFQILHFGEVSRGQCVPALFLLNLDD